jgi:2-polyprenyl-6-methoxyphenol hydroxylase-like FAD-dependent oxidoreductase
MSRAFTSFRRHYLLDFAIYFVFILAKMLADDGHLEVAIIGGGITGLTLALGLLQRGVKFTIYERAQELRELGAGIGFTPNAERAMLALDPRIHESFRKVAVQNKDDWFRYVDGSKYDCGESECLGEHLWLKKYLGERGFEGCRRSDFLRELVNLIPSDSLKFVKNLLSIEDTADSHKIKLEFADGTTENANVGTLIRKSLSHALSPLGVKYTSTYKYYTKTQIRNSNRL